MVENKNTLDTRISTGILNYKSFQNGTPEILFIIKILDCLTRFIYLRLWDIVKVHISKNDYVNEFLKSNRYYIRLR